MRSRSTSLIPPRWLFLTLVTGMVMAPTLTGCSQPAAVGGPCAIGVPATASTVTASGPALECEGRICLQVGSAPALCTAGCRNDDDCGTVAPAGTGTCHQGFTCAVPMAVGSYACQRLCVCRDTLPQAAFCPGGSP